MLVVLSMEDPKRFMAKLSPLVMPTAPESGGALLEIVDWHSCSYKNIDGVEMDGNVLRSAKDITTVGIAIDQAIMHNKNILFCTSCPKVNQSIIQGILHIKANTIFIRCFKLRSLLMAME